MKKVIFGTLLFALLMVVPVPTMAGVDVNVNIGLPPLIEFSGPPEMVVLPETNVYVVPDVDVDIFFYNGWWWRPWQGRWYRSQYYNSGWGYYQGVPSFYGGIYSGWRNDYRNHSWRGHRWNYQRIPHQQVERNWGSWEKSKHWENQHTWGVEGLRSRTQSQQKHQGNLEGMKVEQQHLQKHQGNLEGVKVEQQHLQKHQGNLEGVKVEQQHLQKHQGNLEGVKVEQQHLQKHQGNLEKGKGEKQNRDGKEQHSDQQQGSHEGGGK